MNLNSLHHVAIICSDYQKSKNFYTNILGFSIINEIFRAERNSYKLDLALEGKYILEIFSFPNPPKRVSQPEACGLRHLCFEVDDIEKTVEELKKNNIFVEQIRIDQQTNKKYTFFNDPDNLPLELYEK
ncbi:MAG: hypothetical protein A2086_11205 [Spirochaetes bacterium GWD1_27_9]|nr:MAG: hypothetical protein A2Z98_03705 [Spirochaetes bacterium GWB1_27_13]OHD23758.1 MAG: hypothetical protein A2Y34_03215 [Spirochaetes bacterium GWC1_27_15]OHD41545.1 MAG: hypothetical protein A2086_11205 [Spirochaetes bacterium GWD1_27_9]